MREDMKKVLTERPRNGSRWASTAIERQRGKSKRYRDRSLEKDGDEEFCSHQPMSMGRGTKKFTDDIGPLKRWIHDQVGRKWDDVWADVCANVDANSVQGRHVRSHVWSKTRNFGYVETDIVISESGTPMVVRAHFGGQHPVNGLYVDPRDGILKEHDGNSQWIFPGGSVKGKLTTLARRYLHSQWSDVESVLLRARDTKGNAPSAGAIRTMIFGLYDSSSLLSEGRHFYVDGRGRFSMKRQK